MPQNCTSTNSRSIHETTDYKDAPKRPKATIEEVEDEEDMEMKRKPKARGPGILEDVDEDVDDHQTPTPTTQPCPVNNVEIKVHPILEFKPEKCSMGKTERFLQRIKETKKMQ